MVSGLRSMIVLISSADFRPFIQSLSSPIRNGYRDRTPMSFTCHFLHSVTHTTRDMPDFETKTSNVISTELTPCRNCYPASQKFVFPGTRKFIIVKSTTFWKFIDVSEVFTASIFWIEESDDRGIIIHFSLTSINFCQSI
jgi:hypothetical protein